jgi:hypothetical protein
MMHRRKTVGSLLGLLCLSVALSTALPPRAAASEPAAEAPSPPATYDELRAEAWARYKEWDAAAEETVPADLEDLARRLWEMGRRAPAGSPEAAAKGEALHLWVHLKDLETLEARIASLEAADPVWQRVVLLMAEVGRLYPEEERVERVLARRAGRVEDPETRALLWRVVGETWGEKHRPRAEAAFRKAMEAAPGSAEARVAKGYLYELEHLHLGEPAPAFEVATLGGGALRSQDLAGKAVILDVWASW